MKKKYLLFASTILLGMFLLTSCDTSSLAENFQESIIDALVPNFWAFLTQFLALIVLIVLVSIFAYKPIRKFLDSRSDYLDNEIKSANKNNADSKVRLQEAEQNVADSRKEAVKIIEEAKDTANTERKKILDDTSKEVIKMKAKSEQDIKDSRVRAEKDVQKEIVNVALDASKHVLNREINEEDNKKIIDAFVTSLGGDNKKDKEIK